MGNPEPVMASRVRRQVAWQLRLLLWAGACAGFAGLVGPAAAAGVDFLIYVEWVSGPAEALLRPAMIGAVVAGDVAVCLVAVDAFWLVIRVLWLAGDWLSRLVVLTGPLRRRASTRAHRAALAMGGVVVAAWRPLRRRLGRIAGYADNRLGVAWESLLAIGRGAWARVTPVGRGLLLRAQAVGGGIVTVVVAGAQAVWRGLRVAGRGAWDRVAPVGRGLLLRARVVGERIVTEVVARAQAVRRGLWAAGRGALDRVAPVGRGLLLRARAVGDGIVAVVVARAQAVRRGLWAALALASAALQGLRPAVWVLCDVLARGLHRPGEYLRILHQAVVAPLVRGGLALRSVVANLLGTGIWIALVPAGVCTVPLAYLGYGRSAAVKYVSQMVDLYAELAPDGYRLGLAGWRSSKPIRGVARLAGAEIAAGLSEFARSARVLLSVRIGAIKIAATRASSAAVVAWHWLRRAAPSAGRVTIRVAVSVGAVGVVGCTLIAPVELAFGWADCSGLPNLLELGTGGEDARPRRALASVESISWGLWGVVGTSPVSACVGPGDLVVAYSPDVAELFPSLIAGFEASRAAGSSRVIGVKLDTADMLQSGLDGKLHALAPDSDLGLPQLEQNWRDRHPGAGPVVGRTIYYASSPLVYAVREAKARKMGYPDRELDWDRLVAQMLVPDGLRWTHPAPTTSVGLLTLQAEFAHCAEKADLTVADIESPANAECVRRLERTVRGYAVEDEERFLAALTAGRYGALEAFPTQARLVTLYNRQASGGQRLIPVSPRLGDLELRHPLVRLDGPGLTPERQATFAAFAHYLATPEAAALVRASGYELPTGGKPAGDPLVVPMLNRVWLATKRPANIYLLADVSGSMSGARIQKAREALHTFVGQVEGDREQVGLIAFSGQVQEVAPLCRLPECRAELDRRIDALKPGGDTALYDATLFAVSRLQAQRDPDRTSVLVVMSDGKDNASTTQLEELVARVRSSDPAVVVFCVAYGDDADSGSLRRIAEAADGRAFLSHPATIRRIYELIRQYL